MEDHKLTLIRRRARGRIASVSQLDTATPDGASHHESENRTTSARQPAQIAPGLIIFLVVLLGLLLGLWFVL